VTGLTRNPLAPRRPPAHRPFRPGAWLRRSQAHGLSTAPSASEAARPAIGRAADIIRAEAERGRQAGGGDGPPASARSVRRPAAFRARGTLRLTTAEGAFLRERLAPLRRMGGHEPTLLARLVQTGAAAPSGMWATEARAVAGPDQASLIRRTHGVEKAIPDASLLAKAYAAMKRSAQARAALAAELEGLNTDPVETPTNLADEVRRRLADNPVATWDDAVRAIAEEDE
jgi:hypothetical protein